MHGDRRTKNGETVLVGAMCSRPVRPASRHPVEPCDADRRPARPPRCGRSAATSTRSRRSFFIIWPARSCSISARWPLSWARWACTRHRLKKSLTDSYEWVRIEAAVALWQIVGQPSSPGRAGAHGAGCDARAAWSPRSPRSSTVRRRPAGRSPQVLGPARRQFDLMPEAGRNQRLAQGESDGSLQK